MHIRKYDFNYSRRRMMESVAYGLGAGVLMPFDKVFAAGNDNINKASAQFLEHGRPDVPACLVLDIRMPGMGGMELQRQLIEAADRIPVIFITGHGDIPMTVRAMKAGAADFLAKPFSDDDLLAAIEQAIAADRQTREQRAQSDWLLERYETLTAREREVMSKIVHGMLNKQAAAELGISEMTVKVHRHNIMQKMGARSLPELVRMVEKIRAVKPV